MWVFKIKNSKANLVYSLKFKIIRELKTSRTIVLIFYSLIYTIINIWRKADGQKKKRLSSINEWLRYKTIIILFFS